MINYIMYSISPAIELTNIFLCYKYILQAPVTKKKWKIALLYAGIVVITLVGLVFDINIHDFSIDVLYCVLMPLAVMEKQRVKWMLLFPCAFMISSIINISVSFIAAFYLEIPQTTLTDDIMLYVPVNSAFAVIMLVVIVVRRIRGSQREYMLFWTNSLYAATTAGTISSIY